MVHAYVQHVPIDVEQYWRIIEAMGPEPLEGSLLHLCVRTTEGALQYISVWEDEGACARAFEERIHPAVDRVLGGGGRGPEPRTDLLDVVDARGALLRRDAP